MAEEDETFNKIDSIYEASNFPTLDRLYKLVKEAHPEISRQYVKTFLDGQQETQLLKRKMKPQINGYITAAYPNQKWCIDLYDYSKFLEKNNGYRYIFTVIDVFSRKAYCEPLNTVDIATDEKLVGVGRKHCTITYDPKSGWILKDEFSKSGTWAHLKFFNEARFSIQNSYPVLMWSGMKVRTCTFEIEFKPKPV